MSNSSITTVISQIACIKGVGEREGDKMGGGGKWAAGGRLKLPTEPFGVAISPRTDKTRPRQDPDKIQTRTRHPSRPR